MNPTNIAISNSSRFLSSENPLIRQSRHFHICIANTPQLKEEVFRIRYQVYCEELGYEPLDKFPDQLEKDAYDHRSLHCLIRHKPTGIYAGCVRLVTSDRNDSEAEFPFENVCSDHLIDFNQTPRSQFGEVSRLAVIREFRQWKEEENRYHNHHNFLFSHYKKEIQQPRLSIIPFSLYLANIAMGLELGLEYGVTLMEPRLARHLRMNGLMFRPIGQLVEFRGKRAPFIMKTSEMFNDISKNTKVYDLFKIIQATIRKGYFL
jgi:N-acyl amino acid synthase of PEP-CTERM/exosortase system